MKPSARVRAAIKLLWDGEEDAEGEKEEFCVTAAAKTNCLQYVEEAMPDEIAFWIALYAVCLKQPCKEHQMIRRTAMEVLAYALEQEGQ